MNKLYKYFYRASVIRIVVTGVFAALFFNVLFIVVDMSMELHGIEEIESYTTTLKDFITIVLLAPFIESLFFQYVPLKIAGLFRYKIKYIYCIAIIISSIGFGLLHFGGYLYPLIAFFYGLIWSYFCLIFIRRKKAPLLYTALIHACYNGLLFGVSFLFENAIL